MIQVAEDTSAIRKSDPIKRAAALEGRSDAAMKININDPLTVDPGGIDLGQGNYLEVVDHTEEGAPRFDPAQLKVFEQNFMGVIPVPILPPAPVNIFLLSGINKSDDRGADIGTAEEDQTLALSH